MSARLDGPGWGLLLDRTKPVGVHLRRRVPIAASRATRSRARCSRMAVTCCRARSSITGRAGAHHGGTRRQQPRSGRRRAQRAGRPASDRARHGGQLREPARLDRPRPAIRASACSRASCRSASITRPSSGRSAPGCATKSRSAPSPGSAASIPTAHHGSYDKAYLFCDVAVVGGGPAGSRGRDCGGRSRRRDAALRRVARTRAARCCSAGSAAAGRPPRRSAGI